MNKLTFTPSLLLLFLSSLLSSSIAADTLTPSQPLIDGQTLVSAGGNFVLGFFSPANSNNRYVGIWYNNISIHTVVWVANRRTPITNSTGVLSLSTAGTLSINADNSTVVWSNPMAGGVGNPVAQILDSGNLVVRSGSSSDPAWQSFDYPTDTLLAGMKLGWNLTSGHNRNLTSWRSPSDPSPGNYCMWLDTQGDPQVLLKDGPELVWRAGPWDGLRFTGIPEMETYNAFNFTFVNSADEIYYTFHVLNDSIVTRLVVDGSGRAQRMVWLDESGSWSIFWFAPKDPCDDVSPCGPYGVCDANDSPVCSCLPGFEPRSPEDWAMRDGRGGCVRRTAVDCRNGTDGFAAVRGAKLPDTARAVVNASMGLEECRAACLSNCSCTAYASADIMGGGSGCINWLTELTDLRVYMHNGQNLYVRLAAADLGSKVVGFHKRGQVIIIIAVAAFLGTLLLAWASFLIWIKKKRTRRDANSFGEHYTGETTNGNHDLELPLIDLDTIMTATNYFSIEKKLGQGGFGPVYKGNLGEGQDIAVKRLAKTSVQGIDEFKNEVMLIAKLQHRNLVRLLGCCVQGEERILIYEYMPNKSLDAFLFDKEKGALDWQTRYHIILGIARGLLYLHQDSRFRIIHRDLKASNILLDKEMNPKISDFGLARMFGGDETEVNTKKVVGTYGYMSPEYAMDGIFSVKSDVFSFGVLVLEIISGKKNRGFYLSEPHLNLLGHAWSLWKEDKGLEFVDISLCSSLQMVEVMRCIKVGLLCVQERPEDRPTMSSVVLMMASDNAVLPHPKQPGFIATRCLFDVDLSSSKPAESLSVNEMTVTMFDGR